MIVFRETAVMLTHTKRHLVVFYTNLVCFFTTDVRQPLAKKKSIKPQAMKACIQLPVKHIFIPKIGKDK